MTIISRHTPAAPIDSAADVEYGVLANQLTMAIYPDLICSTHTCAISARERIADLLAIDPALECSLMYRVRGGRWREVDTGRSPRQVLADRWHIRIGGGGW